MHHLLVVNDPLDWKLSIPGVELVSARSYLTEANFTQMRRVRLFNLCRSYRYQSIGYYVSLLGEARGHRPQPSVGTIQDFRLQGITRLISADLEEEIQKALERIRSSHFTLRIYFGRNIATRYQRLAMHLYQAFPAPLLQADFVRLDKVWTLQKIQPIAASMIPSQHEQFVAEAATSYFRKARPRWNKEILRYDVAILYSPEQVHKPSNERAIEKFIRLARQRSVAAEVIDRSSITKLAQYDGLWIRDTTAVNHYTYRFSRRAAAEGLAVIDDPESILRCTNKVYLAQLLARHRLRTPKTMVLHRDNMGEVAATLGFPCILKQPDSSFSQGVVKIENEAGLWRQAEKMLEHSDLLVGQEFLPTPFDWRVGVIDGQPLYVCKYHMARNHWQIVKRSAGGCSNFGEVEAVPLSSVPTHVVEAALRAAALIGEGLYGVDLKQIGDKAYVIEVNDNPNVDAGFEDKILKDQLYLRILDALVRRIEQRSLRSQTSDKNKVASL